MADILSQDGNVEDTKNNLFNIEEKMEKES
jgi:hypothetical protein